MKILLVCSLYRPNIGGIETMVVEMANEYRRLGHTVAVLTKRWPTNLPEYEVYDQTPVYRFSSTKGYIDQKELGRFIEKYGEDLRAEVIHLVGARRPMPLLVWSLSELWSVPCVLTVAGGEVPHKNDLPSKKIWDEGVETAQPFISVFDSVTACSQSVANDLLRVLPSLDVRVLLAGINTNHYRSTAKKGWAQPFVVAIRRLEYEKGIDLLIKAFDRITRIFPYHELIIIGDGSEKKSLESLAGSMDCSERIHFLGTLPLEGAIGFLKSADVMVMPSRSEGGGLVNIEAQSVGCPVIASDCGGIPEYTSEKSAILFRAGDVEDLARSLEKILSDQKLRKKLSFAGRLFAGQFDWKRLIPEYINLYKDLIARHMSRSSEIEPTNHSLYNLFNEYFPPIGMVDKEALDGFLPGALSVDKSLQVSADNEIFLVHDNRDTNYALRVGKSVDEEDALFETSLLIDLSISGVPVAVPIETKERERFIKLANGDIVTLFKWIEGRHPVIKLATPLKTRTLVAAGRQLAEIHKATLSSVHGIKRRRSITTELKKLLRDEDVFKKYFDEADLFIEQCRKEIKFAQRSNDPLVLLHNDYRPQNVLLEPEDRISAVLDFDWACFGPAIKDVAHSVIEWSFPDGAEGFHLPSIQSFLAGYNSVSERNYELTEELKGWMYFSAISDAATYFVDRLQDLATVAGARKLMPLKSYMYTKAKKSLEL